MARPTWFPSGPPNAMYAPLHTISYDSGPRLIGAMRALGDPRTEELLHEALMSGGRGDNWLALIDHLDSLGSPQAGAIAKEIAGALGWDMQGRVPPSQWDAYRRHLNEVRPLNEQWRNEREAVVRGARFLRLGTDYLQHPDPDARSMGRAAFLNSEEDPLAFDMLADWHSERGEDQRANLVRSLRPQLSKWGKPRRYAQEWEGRIPDDAPPHDPAPGDDPMGLERMVQPRRDSTGAPYGWGLWGRSYGRPGAAATPPELRYHPTPEEAGEHFYRFFQDRAGGNAIRQLADADPGIRALVDAVLDGDTLAISALSDELQDRGFNVPPSSIQAALSWGHSQARPPALAAGGDRDALLGLLQDHGAPVHYPAARDVIEGILARRRRRRGQRQYGRKGPRRGRTRYAQGGRPGWKAKRFPTSYLLPEEAALLNRLSAHPDPSVSAMARQASRGDTSAMLMLHDAILDSDDPEAQALIPSLRNLIASGLRLSSPDKARRKAGFPTAYDQWLSSRPLDANREWDGQGIAPGVQHADTAVINEFMLSRPDSKRHAGLTQDTLARPIPEAPPQEPKPDEPRRAKYAGVHAPAGGIVVRGIHYPGGKFIPAAHLDKAPYEQWRHVQQQLAKHYRRADGSIDVQRALDDHVIRYEENQPVKEAARGNPVKYGQSYIDRPNPDDPTNLGPLEGQNAPTRAFQDPPERRPDPASLERGKQFVDWPGNQYLRPNWQWHLGSIIDTYTNSADPIEQEMVRLAQAGLEGDYAAIAALLDVIDDRLQTLQLDEEDREWRESRQAERRHDFMRHWDWLTGRGEMPPLRRRAQFKKSGADNGIHP